MLNEIQLILDKVPHPVACFGRMGSVLTLDIGDARTVPVNCRQYSEKFFFNRCHVTLCGAGEHRVGSQMTEVRGQRGRTGVCQQRA